MRKLEDILGRWMPTKDQFVQNSLITSVNRLYRTEINRSEIMRRAQKIKKKSMAIDFSDALKQSWEIEKNKVNKNRLNSLSWKKLNSIKKN